MKRSPKGYGRDKRDRDDAVEQRHDPYQVVGVSPRYSSYPLQGPVSNFYLPFSKHPPAAINVFFLIRATEATSSTVQHVQSELQRIQPDAMISVSTMRSGIENASQEVMTVVYPMTPLIATGMLLTGRYLQRVGFCDAQGFRDWLVSPPSAERLGSGTMVPRSLLHF